MTDINKKILKAMEEENKNTQALHGPEDQADVLKQIARSFRGPFKLMFPVIIVMKLATLGLGIYFAYEMLNSSETADKIDWLAGLLLCGMTFVILRLFFFMELQRLSLIREIKRLELRMTLLSESINKNDDEQKVL